MVSNKLTLTEEHCFCYSNYTTIYLARTKTTRCALTRRWHPFRPSTMSVTVGGANATILRPRPTLPVPQNHGCCRCRCCLPACVLERGNRPVTVVNARQRSPSDHCKALNRCAKFWCEISALADRPTTDLRAGPGRETNARCRLRVSCGVHGFSDAADFIAVFSTVPARKGIL